VSAPRHHYTADEIGALRRRFAELTTELNAVFDEIAEKVTALSEEIEGDDRGALAEIQAQRLDHRPARG